MKKIACNFMIVLILILIALPATSAGNGLSDEYTLAGREIFPGIEQDGVTKGAVFIGEVLDSSYQSKGYFSVTIDHDGNGIEACGQQTEIFRFKLVLSLTNIGRLVLVMYQPSAIADWSYDDPNCPFGGFCWNDDTPIRIDDLEDCTIGDLEESLIAEVEPIVLKKQWLGTFGSAFRAVQFASIYGLLIHTPPLVPAVIGYLTFSE